MTLDLIDNLEAPLFECGSGHFTQGYGSFVGILAPDYLDDDSWFGPAVLSEKQMTIKEAYEHAVSERQLLHEDDIVEPKDIHETIYRIATSSGKTTTQLNPTGVGGWQSGICLGQFI
ncbi:hypothetical protein SWZG_00078 [Synechococcus phage S-SKS1]|uniref:Uncharacterized protein n=1 Tax=Synechococcus phage S-SKS1 TaxID=754042 RepID=M4QPC4_9CAUD|nr:hypothetical protein SWZG_00078 [Synechococcus phage S-SKS1]AGH31591.1 hypothetical protein SWZG_00078 [Synechococcus phage S-SKS1]